jgi:hypothetical protein
MMAAKYHRHAISSQILGCVKQLSQGITLIKHPENVSSFTGVVVVASYHLKPLKNARNVSMVNTQMIDLISLSNTKNVSAL